MPRITATLVLPPDVDITPVAALPRTVQAAIADAGGEWAVTRPRSRTPSRVVDAEMAGLLEQFRDGATIAEAVARFAVARDIDPAAVLAEALPALQPFIASSWLVPADQPQSESIGQSLAIDTEVAGFTILDCRSLLEDSELYLARARDGGLVAVKLMTDSPRSRRMIASESRALRAIGGPPVPRVLAEGEHDGRPYLVTQWCDGMGCFVRATELRDEGDGRALLDLGASIAEAYADLHDRGVLHGDVHPGNVLVMPDGGIRIVDFGLAVTADSGHHAAGGVVYYFDPQHAAAELGAQPAEPLTAVGEQYSVAALLYFLLSGRHHHDFSAERLVALRQLADDDALPLGAEVDPGVATVLARALQRNPARRFEATPAFAAAMRDTVGRVNPTRRLVPGGTHDDSDDAYVDEHLARLRAGGPAGVAHAPGPHGSIMFGAAGVAYGMLRIAGVRGDPQLLAEATDWALAATAAIGDDDAFADGRLDIGPGSVGEISPFHTASGVHLVTALVGQAGGDVSAVRQCIERYLGAVDRPSTNPDLTIGRTSVVLGCAQLLEVCRRLPVEFSMPDAEARLIATGDAVLAETWAQLDRDAPGVAETRVPFLGIAHGWAGLAYADLLWSGTVSGAPSAKAVEVLDTLAERAERSGDRVRWPITTSGRGRQHNYMTSWCNGAPGFVFLWNAAHGVLGESVFRDLADGAAQETWASRDHIGSICCGYSGRAYALANQWRSTGDAVWLDRARTLADLARRTPASGLSHSLFKGEWGTAVLSAELADPVTARLPLFALDRP